MVCFHTKNPNFGKFYRALDWKMFIYIMALLDILLRFGIFYDNVLHFVFIWYIFLILVSCTKKNLATLFLNVSGWIDYSINRLPTLFRPFVLE
jgi:hypothetical protein